MQPSGGQVSRPGPACPPAVPPSRTPLQRGQGRLFEPDRRLLLQRPDEVPARGRHFELSGLQTSRGRQLHRRLHRPQRRRQPRRTQSVVATPRHGRVAWCVVGTARLIAEQEDRSAVTVLAAELDKAAQQIDAGRSAYPPEQDFHGSSLRLADSGELLKAATSVAARIGVARSKSASQQPSRARAALDEHPRRPRGPCRRGCRRGSAPGARAPDRCTGERARAARVGVLSTDGRSPSVACHLGAATCRATRSSSFRASAISGCSLVPRRMLVRM